MKVGQCVVKSDMKKMRSSVSFPLTKYDFMNPSSRRFYQGCVDSQLQQSLHKDILKLKFDWKHWSQCFMRVTLGDYSKIKRSKSFPFHISQKSESNLRYVPATKLP